MCSPHHLQLLCFQRWDYAFPMSARTVEERLFAKVFEGAPGRLFDKLVAIRDEARSLAGEDGVSLVDNLLEKCIYISFEKYDDAIYKMAEYINQKVDVKRAVVCATAHDRRKDSSQAVLVDIHAALADAYGHIRIQELNRCDRIINSINEYGWQVDDVVFADEFVGTGGSIEKRIRELRGFFSNSHCPMPRVHVVAVAGMIKGREKLLKLADSVYLVYELKKGIEDHFALEEQDGAYTVMNYMECRLSDHAEGEDLPRLGYGKSEAVYGRRRGNCPNNVFPIFWWPCQGDGQPRQTLFRRAW